MIGRWLSKLFLALNERFKPKDPYAQYFNLKLGLVTGYYRIIPKDQVPKWQAKGWVEVPGFSTFGDYPKPDEVFIFGAPKTLMDIEPNTLIGKKIVKYGMFYGSYGMGGPGFFGLEIQDSNPSSENRIVFVYAVWSASSYTLVDDRVVDCHPTLSDRFHPWVSRSADEHVHNKDNLSEILHESEITALDLADDRLRLRFEKNGQRHIIEFVKNDPRLAPYWNGVPLKDAFDIGVIRERFIFQEPGAILFV